MFHSICVRIMVTMCVLAPVSCQTPADLQQHVVVLDEQTFVIPLPTAYVVLEQHAEPAIIRFGVPATRSARSLQFQVVADARSHLPAPMHTRQLDHGHILHYHIHQQLESGSGGTESTLTGTIAVGETTIVVTCRDQAELSPQPTWCLHYLQHLQLR